MNAAHYDEEELVELFERGEKAVARDPHLRACVSCTDTVKSISESASDLHSPDLWEGPELSPDPNPQVLATLRAAQQKMRDEDAAAEQQVKELLAGSREEWMPRLKEHPEWRTAGVVRKLIAATDRAIETMPPDALEIANLAGEIAGGLDRNRYSSVELATLTLGAAREKAYALYVTGRYHDALEVVQGVSSCLGFSPIDDARLHMVQALVLCDLEQYEIALNVVAEALAACEFAGENQRQIQARRIQAIIYYRSRQFRQALDILTCLENEVSVSLAERAGILQNIAIAYRELGNFGQAQIYFARCFELLQRLGHPRGLAKARWLLGRTLLMQGNYDGAVDVLHSVRSELRELGMDTDAAIVSVDIAHAHLLTGEPKAAANECQLLLEYFKTARLTYTEAALTAVSFLSEAARQGRASTLVVHHVRDFLEALPRRPSLAFVPPEPMI
jgi:tetratricopeptide (TPR) repeat protein